MIPSRLPPSSGVGQPTIGRPFYGQAKGLLWLTWISYAGPPQYYITSEVKSPEPASKAKPIPNRTLATQGRQARRLPQPSPAGRQPVERSEVGLFSHGRSPVVRFSPPKAAFILAPIRAPTSPAQRYYIPPEGGALNLPVRRSRSQAEPLAPRAVRPGGAINPRPQGVNLREYR